MIEQIRTSKKFKKAVSAFIVLTTLVLSVVGSLGQTVQVAAADDSTLVVGMECNYAPWNWTQSEASDTAVAIDGGQYCDGYDVQIAKKIADNLGKQLVIKKTSWDGLILALQAGEIDAIIAGMSPTEERKEEINFSDPYYIGKFGVIVKKDGKYANGTTVKDFADAKVTAQMGTSHVALMDQLTGASKLSPMKDFPTMTVALQSGEIDAFIAEDSTGQTIPKSNPDVVYIRLEDMVVDESLTAVSVGIAKGNETLLNEVNSALATISPADREQLMTEAVDRQGAADSDEATTEAEDVNPIVGFFNSIGTFFSQVWDIAKNNANAFLNGVIVTLIISIFATIFGFLIGLFVSIIRMGRVGKVIANIYITIFRGTPMMVQAMIVYYGVSMMLPGFSWSNIIFGNIIAGIIVVTINTGAYMAEIIRGGIQSLDNGQFEAAKSLGMTQWQTMISIILPQAVRNAIPAIGNELIVNIKDTSVLSVISVMELFFTSQSIAGSTYKVFQTFCITSIIYLVLTMIVAYLLQIVERKIDPKSKKRKVSLPMSTTTPHHFNPKEGK